MKSSLLAKRAGLHFATVAVEELAGALARFRILRAPQLLDERADDLADADDPEQVLALQDGQVTDLALAHQPRGVEDVVVGCERDELPRHDVADLHLGEVRPLAGEPQHVALGEDPDQALAFANADGSDRLSSIRVIATWTGSSGETVTTRNAITSATATPRV